jgi:hypothetical protein
MEEFLTEGEKKRLIMCNLIGEAMKMDMFIGSNADYVEKLLQERISAIEERNGDLQIMAAKEIGGTEDKEERRNK